MEASELIPAPEFCIHHNIEISFIQSLSEYGLIDLVVIDEKTFLPVASLDRVEMLVRLHYELGINLEGLDTVTYLLRRTKTMHEQITQLTNKLKGFEAG